MLRSLALVALLACLLWQSFAFVHAGVTPQVGGDAEHSALHWADEPHHHHHGEVQVDDSAESVAHAMSDHGCCAAALPPSLAPMVDIRPDDALPTAAQGPTPTPFVDGWLRPPRA